MKARPTQRRLEAMLTKPSRLDLHSQGRFGKQTASPQCGSVILRTTNTLPFELGGHVYDFGILWTVICLTRRTWQPTCIFIFWGSHEYVKYQYRFHSDTLPTYMYALIRYLTSVP